MRLDEVDICNEAIGLVGATEWIQSLTNTGTVSERRCNRFFLGAVERVLSKHDWHCSSTIRQLAENTTTPLTSYDSSFALPNDCVRVINVYEDDAGYTPYSRWELLERNIETNLDTVFLRYVKFPDDYRSLDILLSTAIAYELALLLAPSYVKDREVFGIILQGRRIALSEAKAIDTLQNKQLFAENDIYEDHRISMT